MNTTAPPGTSVALTRTDVPMDFTLRLQMAEVLASAKSMVPKHYRGDVGAVMAAMMHAAALDIGVWLAMQETFVVDGRVGMSARLMHGLISRAGHKIHFVERTTRLAVIRMELADDPDPNLFAEFSYEDAFAAGVLGKDNWIHYPKDMYTARAISRGARLYTPGVLMGFGYTRDELEDGVIDAEYVDNGSSTEGIKAKVIEIAAEIADAQDRQAITALAQRAEREMVIRQFVPVGHPGAGRQVRTLLAEKWEQFPPDDAQGEREAPRNDQRPAPVEESAPVDADRLACGCLKAGYIASGGHQSDCVLNGGQR